jgi:hypothetical protein
MGSARKLFLILTLTAAMAAAADPRLLNLVVPDSKVVVGIDVQKLYATDFGQFVLSQVPPEAQKLTAATGFDFRSDLYEVVIATPGGSDKNRGIAIASGRFDPVKLLQLVAAGGGQTFTYKGVEVATTRDNKAFAFLNGSIALVGDPDSVQATIDRSRGNASIDPALLTRIGEASAGNQVWLVSNAALSEITGKIPKNTKGPVSEDVLQSIRQASAGVQFGKSVQISAQAITQSDQDATALADSVRLLAGLAQLSQNQQKPPASATASLLNTLKVQAATNTVKLSLIIPEADLEQLLRQSQNKH